MLMQIVHGVAGVTSGKWFSAVPCSISVLGTSRPGEPDCDAILMLGLHSTHGKHSLTVLADFLGKKKCAWKNVDHKQC